MPELKIVSLNVGRLLLPQTRAYLESLKNPEASLPDVLLVQDMPFRDLPLLERFPHVSFGPMTNHLINGVRAVVGIAIASRLFITNITHRTYWGDGCLKDLRGVDGKNARHLGAESDRLVEITEDRLVICAAVGGYEIATTHGMWVRGGVTNDVQRVSMRRLRDILADEAKCRGGLVLGGDLNFGRGGEIYRMFAEELQDRVPSAIETTLDYDHPATRQGIKVVSDYFFTAGSEYTVSDVKVDFGVSNHGLLSGIVSWHCD